MLDTRSWILRRNKRRMNNTLVQELTFEKGVEYRGMFRMDDCDLKTKYETTNKLELLLLAYYKDVNRLQCKRESRKTVEIFSLVGRTMLFSARAVNTGRVQGP